MTDGLVRLAPIKPAPEQRFKLKMRHSVFSPVVQCAGIQRSGSRTAMKKSLRKVFAIPDRRCAYAAEEKGISRALYAMSKHCCARSPTVLAYGEKMVNP